MRLHDLKDELSIYVIPFEPYVKNDTPHVTFSSWRRIDDNVIPARGKVGGAYVNSALIKTDAVDSAVLMRPWSWTRTGTFPKVQAMNVFMMSNGVLITPPVTDNVLEGITRRSVMELAKTELGLEVLGRSIDRTELAISEEIFMTGTAAQVAAVTKVDHRPIGAGKMGPVTAQLRRMFDDICTGKKSEIRALEHGSVKRY